jgi:sucrose phosphorylase
VNRATIKVAHVNESLKDPDSKIARLARGWPALNLTRTRERAFHPHGRQQVLITAPQVFTVLRTSPEGDRHMLAMTNLANKACDVAVPVSALGLEAAIWHDVLSGGDFRVESGTLRIALQPYDVAWLRPTEA